MFILYGNDVKLMVSVAYLSLSKSISIPMHIDTSTADCYIRHGIRFQDKAAAKEIKQ